MFGRVWCWSAEILSGDLAWFEKRRRGHVRTSALAGSLLLGCPPPVSANLSRARASARL